MTNPVQEPAFTAGEVATVAIRQATAATDWTAAAVLRCPTPSEAVVDAGDHVTVRCESDAIEVAVADGSGQIKERVTFSPGREHDAIAYAARLISDTPSGEPDATQHLHPGV